MACIRLFLGLVSLLGGLHAAAAPAASTANPALSGQAPAQALPLEIGKRWTLTQKGSGLPMTIEVSERRGDAWVVRWTNPYVNTQFHFRQDGAKVLLEALDMGTGLARMPEGTVYFDLAAPVGASWKNALGTVSVVDRGTAVNGVADTVEFELRDAKGVRTYWTLSRTAGFVAFGRGGGGFRLEAPAVVAAATPVPSQAVPATATPAPTPKTRAVRRGSADQVLVGIDANPPPTEGYDEAARKERVRLAVRSGATFLYAHPKWTELETSAGRYSFTEVDFKAALADELDLPMSLNLRVIDTNQRAIPDAYKGWRFTDDRMAQRLVEALRAVAPRTRGRVRWIAIGNESDNYFSQNRGEVREYAQLLGKVLPAVRELFPHALFTVNFTHAAAPEMQGLYAPINELVDVVSFTYYPLNADFTFQDPARAGADIDGLVQAAAGKLVLMQEIGYASAAQVNSSEDRQAQFLTNVFQALRRNRNRIIAANFVWMSDLPQSVVEDLGKYYGQSQADRFKAFLGSLGYWDRDGRPKKAWSVFAAEAPRL